MSNNDVYKKSYIINKNLINKNQSNDDDYESIIEEFGIWEKICFQYIKIFNHAKLDDFYFNCKLKFFCKEGVQLQPTWYNDETKKLTYGFADNLYILLKNISIIQSILEDTFASIDKISKDIKNPTPIELIFHTLLTHSSIESYPFTIQNLAKGIDNIDNTDLSQRNIKKIQQYLANIAPVDSTKVNIQYTEWIALYKIYDSSILEFLRRFHPYVSLSSDDKNSELSWNAVSINAVGHYLIEFYNLINSINMTDEGLRVLIKLQDPLALYNSEKFCLSKSQLTNVWKNISSMVKIFQENDIILKFIYISYNNPLMGRELIYNTDNIFEKFQYIMRERVDNLIPIINQQIMNNMIKDTVEKTNEIFDVQITEVGVYTSVYSDKLRTLGLHRFSYPILLATIKVWFTKSINKWFMTFFSFLLTEKYFTMAHKDSMDKLYQKLFAFVKEFENFCQQAHPQLPTNKKLMMFLQGDKITEGEKHLVKVLVHNINEKANLLVKNFRPLLVELCDFVVLFIEDFQNDTNILLKNTKILNRDTDNIEKKFRFFLELCKQLNFILELTDKTQEK